MHKACQGGSYFVFPTQSKLTPLPPPYVVEERKDAAFRQDLEGGGHEEYGDEQRERPHAEVVVELARLRRRCRGRRCRRGGGRAPDRVVIVVVAGVRVGLDVDAVGSRDGGDRGGGCRGAVAVGRLSWGRGCRGVVSVTRRGRSWDEFDGLVQSRK